MLSYVGWRRYDGNHTILSYSTLRYHTYLGVGTIETTQQQSTDCIQLLDRKTIIGFGGCCGGGAGVWSFVGRFSAVLNSQWYSIKSL